MEVTFVSLSAFFVNHCAVLSENLLVFIHIVMAKCKCSINDSIHTDHPFIKGANENVECMLHNAKFCTAHGGCLDVVNHVKTKKKNKLAI
jgi:hypothetical protein